MSILMVGWGSARSRLKHRDRAKRGGDSMDIRTIAISEIKPAEYNPRTISKDQFNGLVKSLETFGQQENLIVNNDMTLISGHQRLEAMKHLGWNEAVCNVVDLTKHQEKKLNVIMNSQAIAGDWDELKLGEILLELQGDEDYKPLRLHAIEPLDLSPSEMNGDGDDKEPKLCPHCGGEL